MQCPIVDGICRERPNDANTPPSECYLSSDVLRAAGGTENKISTFNLDLLKGKYWFCLTVTTGREVFIY